MADSPPANFKMPQTRYASLRQQMLSSILKAMFGQLVTTMFSSIDYLTKKATFKQVAPTIPITQEIPDSEDPAVFEANKKQLVEDLLKKAKEIEFLIDSLPAAKELDQEPLAADVNGQGGQGGKTLDDGQEQADNDPELVALEAEMQEVNAEYLGVLEEAEKLQDQLKATMRTMLDEHHALSSGLLTV